MKPCIDISSPVKQSFNTRDVTWRHWDDGAEEGRRQAMLVEGVGVGSVGQEAFHPGKVAGTAGQVQAGSTVRVSLFSFLTFLMKFIVIWFYRQ
jgi:hypothetical protein